MFKVGDFVFFEYKLAQIKEMKGAKVQEVSDGAFSCGSLDLSDRCVPLTLRNKNISDEYEHQSNRIHREGVSSLNYPDIHRWLVDEWRKCIDVPDSEVRSYYDRLKKFTEDCVNFGKDNEQTYGFSLSYRRRN